MSCNEDDLDSLRNFLRGHLLEHVMPFWQEHAIDPAGGINSCIADDGRVISRDKWMWSQWRAVWVFSRLQRHFPGHGPWLECASGIYEFARRHGFDHQGACVLTVSGDGDSLRGAESLYADAFAIYGLTELTLASGREEPLDLAQRIGDRCRAVLMTPHDRIPHFPYPVPSGARVHGLPMIFSLHLWELGALLGMTRFQQSAIDLSDEIFQRFHRPEFDLIVERIADDGSLYPGPLGTAVNPGHVIEDMWFQMRIAHDRGDWQRLHEAIRLMRRHLEFGWDEEFGGIFLARDAGGQEPIGWDFADTKLWWPQVEAMIATLMAYELTGEAWCLDWYRRVHEYAFSHYPVETGEWTQRLDRTGRPFDQVVALPVKDPFHLPRALILCIETLDRILAKQPRAE